MTTDIRKDPETPLTFHDLRFLREGDEVVIGRAEVECNPRLAGAWVNLGALHWEEGEIEEALRCFEESLALQDDEDVRANRELAVASGQPT